MQGEIEFSVVGPNEIHLAGNVLDNDDGDDMDDDHEGDVCEGGTFESMGEQDRYWSVGVMPQGSLSNLSISSRLYLWLSVRPFE